MRVQLSSSETLPLSLPMCLSTSTVLFSPNKYFACFTTFCLCGNSSLQEGPGPMSLTAGPMAGIWCFHRHDPTSAPGWKPKPMVPRSPTCTSPKISSRNEITPVTPLGVFLPRWTVLSCTSKSLIRVLNPSPSPWDS